LEGKLEIECPDMLQLAKNFVEANEFGRYCANNFYHPLINQIYGHQRGRTDAEKLAQVHKSGYTFEHLSFVLSGIGFGNIEKLPYKKGPPGTAVMRLSCKKTSVTACKEAKESL
jgi:hypothetical protein